MKNNQYTATPNWFKDVQQQQQVVTTQTNYYIGGASGSGGLQFINLYNKFKIESYRITVDDLLINNNAIIAADIPLSEGEERPEGFVSEIGNNVEAENWHTSYLISVVPSTNLVANLKANSNRYGIVFYDEYNQSISGYTSVIDELVTIPVPEKARYFRCCHYIEPAIEPVESTDSETEESVEPTYEFYIEYAGIGSYDDSDLNTAYGDVFENFTNVNSSVPEGINIKQLNTSDLNLIFQQPLSCTVDKSNNIKIGLDKVFTESIGNQDLWELIEDEQGNKYIVTDYNIVGRGGITAYYDGDLTPGSGGGLGGGSLADIEVIGEGNALINAYLNENKSIITFEKKWLIDADSEQDINGIKNFTNGFKLNNQLINIIDGVLYLDCSIAVTGGITAYATMPGEGSSSIMDQLVVDTKYFIITEEGVLTIVPGSIGGISNIYVTGDGNALTTVTLSEDGKTISFTKDKNFADQAEMSVYKAEVNQTIAEFKNDVNEQLKHFVTLDTEQEITAIKHFIEGVTIGSNKHKFYEKDGVLWLEGDIAITGGITTYATENIDVSTIMDGVTVDEVTLTKENGVIKIKNAGSGSSFDKTAMWAALSAATNEQINISHLTTALSGYAIKSDLNISNWNAAYSWGNHAVAGYAKQTALDTVSTDLDAVSTKLNDFLEGSDTDNIINKWKELEAFLSGMSESDNLAEILLTKADKTYVDTELKKYVTIADEQTITGLKHFTSGLSIGASKHKLYEQDGVVYLDGDLAVTGGITAYAQGSRTVSTILDGLVIDETTLTKEGGKLSVIGGVGDASNWDELEGKPSWITDTKPVYNWNEIGNKPTTLGGYGITNAYTKTDSDNRFVNVSGDTMTGSLSTKDLMMGTDSIGVYINGTSNIGIRLQYNKGNNEYDQLFIKNGLLIFNNNKVWHEGNDGHGSGLDADILDGLSWSDFFSRRYYSFNLNSYSTSNFYPLFFHSSDIELDCEIHSNNVSGNDAYNQNRLHFQLTTQGWSDTGTSFHLLSQNNYDNDEITIGAIGKGLHRGGIAIWVRGGRTYRVYTNREPVFKSSNYTYDDEVYSVGTNLWGGTNSQVEILWKNDSTRKNALIATLVDNVASATKLQTPRTIWGQSFDGTANITGSLTSVTDITGTGTFTGANIKATDSVYVNGIRLHKTVDGAVTIEGNLLVTGGITAYSTGEEGGSSGGGIDVDVLWEILGGTGTQQINKSHLTDALEGYLTRAESDNKYLLKSIYTAQDILNKLKTVDGANSGLDADTVDGYQISQLFVNNRDVIRLTDIDNFKNRESGTYSVLDTGASGLLTVFRCNRSTSALEIFTQYDWKRAKIRMTIDSNRYSSWKDLAFLDSNVASATKLQTPRTIWGQNFDGTANVSGNMTEVGSITANNYIQTKVEGIKYIFGNSNKGITITPTISGSWTRGLSVYDDNNQILAIVAGIYGTGQTINYNYYGGISYNTAALYILPNKNVGIGTSSPSQKLDVNGNARASTFISTVETGTAPLTVNSTTLVNNLNADLLDGYHIDDIQTGGWFGLTAYENINNIVKYNWYKIATLDNVGSCAIEIDTKTDYNYIGCSRTYLYMSSYNSISKHVGILNNGSIDNNIIQVVLDTNNDVWIRANSSWSHFFRYRILRNNGITIYTTNQIKVVNTLKEKPNSSSSTIKLSGGISLKNKVFSYSVSNIFANSDTTTKLQTARTIWGQSFDGTANISGNMTDVGSISASNNSYLISNSASNPYLRLIAGGMTNYIQVLNDGRFVIGQSTSTSNNIIINTNGNVGMGTTSASYKLDVSGDIHARGWLRTTGNYGWYSQTYGGGWYMTDSTYIRTYGSKKVYSNNGYLAPYSGSTWIGMATRTNIINGDQNQSTSQAHALYRVKSSDGHAVCFGGLGNVVGFYGFYKSRIDANNNGLDWSTTWDATTGTLTHRGNFISTGDIKVGSNYRMYKDSTGALVLEGDIKVNGNILSTGGVTAYTSSAASGTQFLYDVSSYDAYTSTSTTRAPSVRAVKLIKDKVNSVSSTATSALSKLSIIKSELSSLSSSSSSSSIGAALKRIADSI